MSAPHPLNQAILAQALHDLRHGQLRRCKAMGFFDEALEALKRPEMVSLLANATVSWCTVKINDAVLRRLLHQAPDVVQEIETIDRMLRLGASTEMVGHFYGLTHQEVALRRDMLGMPKRKGRWPVLTEAQEQAVWAHWQPRIKAGKIDPRDDTAMLPLCMDAAEALQLPMAVIWNAMQGWIGQGLI
ncbi:DUF2857 domain-containing protein [Ralstonia pseudosolanacearum]|uniref:DUF2857 domain-containing protein n=1 Tax=Ralstonia pseudosolanacearum TaxID=1310165 RepID=UPI00405474D2